MISRLKELRQENGISQKQLADIIHVSQQSINKYENHEVEPNIETLCLIAEYFKTSVDYLIGFANIKRQYEPVKDYDLNKEEQRVVDVFRALSKNDREIILSLATRLTKSEY